ncbi:unnamed protein product [Protopolystoma xenopodis]|uniref:Uncharacterized protein n=1 Tax=Protopolystoma xenopodis TaxID=117903 RepID=A0A448WCD7_9PLAT|nr:unnamed protein product [Protopolystoma xenopodis]
MRNVALTSIGSTAVAVMADSRRVIPLTRWENDQMGIIRSTGGHRGQHGPGTEVANVQSRPGAHIKWSAVPWGQSVKGPFHVELAHGTIQTPKAGQL